MATTTEPRIAIHIVNQGPGMGTPDQGPRPNIAILMFDAHGEAHARSSSAFAWAFAVDGAQEISASMVTLRELHAVAETFRDYQGDNQFWLSAPLLEGNLDEEDLVRAWKWYEDTINLYPGFGAGSTILLEFVQKNAFNSSPSRTSTAWPHSGHKHVSQVVVGCRSDDSNIDIRKLAHSRLQVLSTEVAGIRATGEYHTGFLHEWNNPHLVCGENFGKLKEVNCASIRRTGSIRELTW